MCAINGFNFNNKELLLKMNKATNHRGPDGTGHFVNDQISFGHNLLAITELPKKSRQPFVSEGNNYVLTYNGEIYNYRSLRRYLEKLGSKFYTDCDTEVLFQGLIKEGPSFISKLNGMFAFAFYDRKNNKIFLARDFSGIKPLYYHHFNKKIIFSSEIRGILTHEVSRRLDKDSANAFFILGYVPGQRTLIEGIKKVCPGQCIELDLKDGLLTKTWLGQLKKTANNFDPEVLREKINKSVLGHTMGLRPFGIYLSGGLDSTAVLYELMKNKSNISKSYTTRFDVDDEAINEDARIAKRLSSDYGIDHCELLIDEDNFIKATEEVIKSIEEPRYNPSLAAYWLLAREASKDITIVLSGSGGDELFLGYPKYLFSRLNNLYNKYPASILNTAFKIKNLNKSIKLKNVLQNFELNNLLDRWIYLNKLTNKSHLPFKNKSFKLFNYDLIDLKNYLLDSMFVKAGDDIENELANLDRLFWLADEEFIRTDKITMRFGMEGRFPLLDSDIIDYTNSISSREKIAPHNLKIMMKKAYENRLPDYVINKRKTGWKAPVSQWMNGRFGIMIRDILSEDYYRETNDLFDFEYIKDQYLNKSSYSTVDLKKFMPIVSFQIWAKSFNIKL